MSDDAMVICDTRAKLAELDAMPHGALVEHLTEVFSDSIRRKANSIIAAATRDPQEGC
jgi:hypothetical protein